MSLLLQLTTLDEAPAHPAWLGDDERARLAGITDPTRAAQFVAGHCLARHLAASLSGGSAEHWRLVVGAEGRRRLEHAQFAPLFASISHARSLLAVAVGPQPLGVDLETSGRSRDWLAVARSVFSPAEVQALEALPETGRESSFLTTWTLKEAWAKRSGRGLQRQAARRCTARACDPADAEAWTWWQTGSGPLALAAWAGASVHARGATGEIRAWRYQETQA